MKNILLLFSLLAVHYSFSQQNFCGHNEKRTNYFTPNSSGKAQTNVVKSDGYIIPVVFHVLHLNGPENISDEQIQSALQALNEDFNKQNWDTINVVSEFANNIANVGVTFKLAKLDPNGDSTTGINRIYTNLTNHGWEDSSKINQWPPTKYLNIWVCKSLEGYAAAYSWYPYYADFYPELDGIMQQHDYTGFVGTANDGVRHVLTHEVGHYLNLMHTWDNAIDGGPCGDDDVADTPITQSSGCELGLATCNTPIVENVQNFMTGSYCFLMFTEGQKQRMITCLNSPEGGRNNLWKEQNLIETGLFESSLSVAQLSKPDFKIYPNPAINEVIVSFDAEITEVTISDLLGKSIPFSTQLTTNQLRIDVSEFRSGTYFIRSNNWNEKMVICR